MGTSNSKDDQYSSLNDQTKKKEKKEKKTKSGKSDSGRERGQSSITARTSEISASLAELNRVDDALYTSDSQQNVATEFSEAAARAQERAKFQVEPKIERRHRRCVEETGATSRHNNTTGFHQPRDQAVMSSSGAEANANILGTTPPSAFVKRHTRMKSNISYKRESFLEPVDENQIARPTSSYADIQMAISSNTPVDGYDRYRAAASSTALNKRSHQLSWFRAASTISLPADPAALPNVSCTLPQIPSVRLRPRSRNSAAQMPTYHNHTRATLNDVFPTQVSHLGWSERSSSVPDLLRDDGYAESHCSNCSDKSSLYTKSNETLDRVEKLISSVESLHVKHNALHSSIESLHKKQDEHESMLIQVTASRNNFQPRS